MMPAISTVLTRVAVVAVGINTVCSRITAVAQRSTRRAPGDVASRTGI